MRGFAAGAADRRERGSATIWVIGVVAVLFTAVAAVVFAGTVRVARHRAQTAADLGALAAARLVFSDPGRACARAAPLVAENGAGLVGCSASGDGIVAVQVAVRFSLPVMRSGEVRARARAGPVFVADSTGRAAGWAEPAVTGWEAGDPEAR
ncbi:hypothetical protein GCM10010466_64410 [Planomonospora alba]|uniref:Putative Flp pilus-assembly TadG-like N-terminal domain-containing protein n=1 Tax=Planomonospora alba TaxID=161354 RepID=A0ABP6P1Y9_9ACTN